ncbi:TetR family transcriptional regulator C-terminal domain-containing protein [Pseudovibrio sp. Tun.PSC04-5.I4]|uniref:TetR family transcriptional regulator C-terminal domain-containing protein n=1 Tax=Pseudovibrio sp. Tun.PSC04-5.I4 TaxID=1798213 RepID=UPI00088F07A7|nr:TetR family transcriptional regulator C-terminal domain-containing protein [Pseudovibrio sp. Tun.PSC04-5.I4]SDR05114.1 DNA-binding transcriptional regulator, AcrR family [Pseudovibrio sp. Tun.PSC04-5.I4]
MAYLPKEERRKAIILATLEVVAEKGFAGITTRVIATKLGAATGILHHHFKSLIDLKCEALRFLSRKNESNCIKMAQELTPTQTLLKLLSFNASAEERSEVSIWISAADEATREPEFGQVYAEENNKHHQWLCNNLKEGAKAGEFTLSLPAELAAWKLMAVAYNLYDISSLPHTNLSPEMAVEIIKQELITTLGVKSKDLASRLLPVNKEQTTCISTAKSPA